MRLRDPGTNQIPPAIREKEMAFAATLPKRGPVMNLGKGIGTIQAATWNQRGPYNVGGRTRALAIDVTDENIILAGGVSGGMWRSTDGGTSWVRTTSLSQPVQSVTCLAQDTRLGKRNVWYQGTGEYAGNSAYSGGAYADYRGDGIFRSSDGGNTWSILPSTSTSIPQSWDNFFDYVWNIAIDPSDLTHDVIYAATRGAIQYSSDGGVSWTNARGGFSPYATYTDVSVTSTGVVYATLSSDGGRKGIWRLGNGYSWTDLTPAGWPSSFRRIVMGIAPSNSNVVYFLAETPGSGLNNHSLWKYTYISGDGSGSGGVWQNRSSFLPAFGGITGNFDSQYSYDLIVKVTPDNENCVFVGGTSLFRSTDGFASTGNTNWIGGYPNANSYGSYPNHHCDQHALTFFASNPTMMLSGHDGGISKTLNNLSSTVSWTLLNNGYFTTQFYTIAVDHGTYGDPILVGGMQDNGNWLTNSQSPHTPWFQEYSGDGSYCSVADSRVFYLYSAQNGKAYRSTINDVGIQTSWTRIDPSGVADGAYLFINPFAMDPNNNKVLYLAGGDRIWRNSDVTAIPTYSNSQTGMNWTQLYNSAVSGSKISALGISKSPSDRLYYGTWDGRVYRIDGAITGDPNRTDIGTGKGLPANAYVSCIAVDPSDYNKVILVLSNYNIQSLFYTSNGGSTWQTISGNLEQNSDGTGNGPSCRWSSILPIGASRMYFVGTSTGLYSTTTLNGSATVWVQEGPATIGNVVVDMMDTRPIDGLVVAATHANGVFSANILVPPTAPVLASPANTTSRISTNCTVSWNSVSGAASYGVQVATDTSFRSFAVNQSGLTQTFLAISGLLNNTTYYWRVNASNGAGTSAYSTVWYFTTSPPSYSISGAVHYGSSTGVSVNGVTVMLTPVPSGSSSTTMTNTSGQYSFNSVNVGSYAFNISKTGAFPASYVNAADALKASLYSVDPVTYVLSPNQKLAADVNNDGNVNSADALQIMLRYVGNISSFAKGDWVFFTSSSTVTVTNQDVTVDVIGYAVGDVNGDAQAGGAYFTKADGNASVVAEAGKALRVNSTDVFEVPVRVNASVSIGSMSLAFQYPVDAATFVGVRGPEGMVSAANNGVIKAAWYNAEHTLILRDNDAVITLSFKPTNNVKNFILTLDPNSQVTDARSTVLNGIRFEIPTIDASVPTEFTLGQNYPNPFNPSTTISYQLPKVAIVSLNIFNTLGQVVATLVDEKKEPGYYTVKWNANVPSGIYFYRLQAGEFLETKKMILLR